MSWFSVLDLSNAYFHIEVEEEGQGKTAFSFDGRKYQWRRLPFGLQGGAFSLTAALTKILEEFKFAQSYYDDILIFSESKEEHLKHLKEILNALAAYGMQVNKEKCQVMKQEVTFLGHRLSAAGLRPAQQKLGEIVSFPTPQRLEDLKTFLGMAAFFRKFIPKYSQILADLYAM